MYNSFAEIYDDFMDNVPYEEWCRQICDILGTYGIYSGIIAELGCGTGTLTELLSEKGYDMIGIDNSGEMLQRAIEKRDESKRDILYLCQDMREFELYGTCAGIVSRCDSINYITDPHELTETFRLVNNYLDPGGLFIFDVKSEYMFKELLGDRTFSRSNESAAYIWENYYNEKEKINEYDLTMFIKNGELYEKHVEEHSQRAYSPEELRKAAEDAGLIWLGIWDADTEDETEPDTARYLVVLRENGKKHE